MVWRGVGPQGVQLKVAMYDCMSDKDTDADTPLFTEVPKVCNLGARQDVSVY
jgi:hypothetical protein